MPSSVCFCIGAGNFWPTGSVYYEQLAYIADKILKNYPVLADSVVF